MHFTDEAQLIADLKQGRKKAVEVWYKESKRYLVAYFHKQVNQVADVDELVHDTYLSCLSSLPLFRGTSGLFTWMMGIAKHELADYWRKKYAKKVISALPFGDELLRLSAKENLSEESDLVSQVLETLPHATAELLALKYIDGLTLKQLAEKFNVKVVAMQSKLYRAKHAFMYEYEKATGEVYDKQ